MVIFFVLSILGYINIGFSAFKLNVRNFLSAFMTGVEAVYESAVV